MLESSGLQDQSALTRYPLSTHTLFKHQDAVNKLPCTKSSYSLFMCIKITHSNLTITSVLNVLYTQVAVWI